MAITIYHNPRCAKSRQALALLRERGIEPEVVEYLKVPLDAAALESLLQLLGMEPEALMRRGEADYKAHVRGQNLSREQAVAAMVTYPKLIERPIVVNGDRAALGRPPEAVLDIF